MIEEHKQLLDRVLCDVLEQMAFMFARRTAPEEASADGIASFVLARMIFRGPVCGSLTLVAPTEMCTELSANILGVDADDDLARASAIDAFKEILNVLCGHLVTGIAGPDPCFEMAPPVAESLTPEQWDALDLSPETLCFSVDEYPMLMQLEMEGAHHGHPCAGC